MKSALRLTLFTLTVALLAFGCASGGTGGQDDTGGGTTATTEAAGGTTPPPCANVRCEACPEGQTPALRPPDCCRCVPVDQKITDCANVRCASCPVGSHPSMVPPDCCRCVPD